MPTTSAADLEVGNHGDLPSEDSIMKDSVPWKPAEHDTDTPYDAGNNGALIILVSL